MIDIRRLKELVKLMVENDLSELDLRDEQEQVVLRRPYANAGAALAPAQAPAHAPAASPAPASQPGQAAGPAPEVEQEDGLLVVESPMVGTFYSAPDPESPAYVSVGDSVSADTVVCIVEAMKVFNEIKAEVSGTVAEVCVNNGDAVEYGQPLFKVRAG